MIENGDATEDDMIRAFVLAEMNSPAHRTEYDPWLQIAAISREQLVGAAPDDPLTRAVFRLLLSVHRGFGRGDGIFRSFPSDVKWRRVILEADDFERLLYVSKCPPWDELSGNTRLVVEGARTVKSGRIQGWPADAAFAVRDAVEKGEALQPLIVVEDDNGALVLVEGHTRATGYALASKLAPAHAILGTSGSFAGWYFI